MQEADCDREARDDPGRAGSDADAEVEQRPADVHRVAPHGVRPGGHQSSRTYQIDVPGRTPRLRHQACPAGHREARRRPGARPSVPATSTAGPGAGRRLRGSRPRSVPEPAGCSPAGRREPPCASSRAGDPQQPEREHDPGREEHGQDDDPLGQSGPLVQRRVIRHRECTQQERILRVPAARTRACRSRCPASAGRRSAAGTLRPARPRC